MPAGLVHFSWQIIALLFVLLSVSLFYFIYSFIERKVLGVRSHVLIFILLLPVFFLLPTSLNMVTFDIVNCEAVTGPLYYYVYSLMVLAGLSIFFVCVRRYHKSKKRITLIIMLGALSMLFMLVFADLLSEYLGTFEINLVGPIGMLIFLLAITYLIVEFKAFQIKLIGTQALMVGLVALIGSQLFFVESKTNQVLTILTFLFSIEGGILLVRSVRKEISQRAKLEEVTKHLEKANTRLKMLDKQKSEFVSIASHQLRNPLTAVRGYTSLLLEGNYGKLPKRTTEPLRRIDESARLMTYAVEDYLNVSRIESGNMKYQMSEFRLSEIADRVCDDLRPEAIRRGLVLLFKSQVIGQDIIRADEGKVVQIMQNLVQNALKYTQKGTVTVLVRDNQVEGSVGVDVIDTGIGMSQEVLDTIFQKFARGANAKSVDVQGTGLGLYVAERMAEAMCGIISAHSEGEGKGSRFTVEFPLAAELDKNKKRKSSMFPCLVQK